MARIDFEKTVVTRDASAPQTIRDREFYEKTDPGVDLLASAIVIARPEGSKQSRRDDFYEPAQSPPAPKVEKQKSWTPKFLEKRRALKEAAEIIAKLERLAEIPTPTSESAVRYFFNNDLPKLVAAAQIHPEKIRTRLQAALAGTEDAVRTQKSAPWFALASLACGDSQAFVQALENVPQNPVYLFALESVSVLRPREAAHLLRKFFEQADLKNRMAALRTAVVSENLGDGHLIGEFFVKLMAATTKEERNKTVEPFLESLIHKSAAAPGAGAPANHAGNKPQQGKLAWLGAYYHGWKQEKLG